MAATFTLHDRLLSNRRSRSLHAGNRPSVDDVQGRIVGELEEVGYSVASFDELFPGDALRAVEQHAAPFVTQTEANLEQLRQRKGKSFVVRKYGYNRDNILGLEDPWLGLCTSPRLLDIANEFLRLWSKLDYLDYWYSIPVGEGADRRASQSWHRDFEDSHLLKVFLYLSDVDEQAGPLEYVSGSQIGGSYAEIYRWDPTGVGASQRGAELLEIEAEVARRVPAQQVRTFTGPKGTMIFCNTTGLHRGGFAETRPRVLVTASYTSAASLAALTERNYSLAPSMDTRSLDPPVRYALS